MTTKRDKRITDPSTCLRLLWTEITCGNTKNPQAGFEKFCRRLDEAMRRGLISSAIDGYPSSHGSADSVRGGSAEVDTDDPTEPGTVVITGVESMVFRLTDGAGGDDKLTFAANQIGVNAPRALTLVQSIVNSLNLFPTVVTLAADPNAHLNDCTSCARFGIISPRHQKQTRCVWCRDFHAAQGHDPAEELVRKHAAGQRITTTDIDRAHPQKAKAS